jgi:alkanesulfonate monooxygenase SsuD/methylene tetrahydromethanopterin reductase-like flavin-dependent oxidoreductase (luciferase family)
VAAVQIAVCDDADAGKEEAERTFARYGTLENYQRLLAREGVASPGELALVGSEDDVEKQLRRYADVGATELWATVFPVGGDHDASVRRTRALLAQLAPELG